MPQVLLSDSISAELGAQEPWPSDVRFFQPFEVEQILLGDSAACQSVAAFLRMCGLAYVKDERANAEYMSPSGRVPFIKAGAFVVAELDHIISFVGHKNICLTEHLDNTQKADMRAYMSLVTNVLGSAELYVSWAHPDTYNTVTYPRYGSVLPWPLNVILTRQRRTTVLRRLTLLGWRSKSMEEVCAEVGNCCRALSQRLDTLPFFFGNSPTELDAVVFGHLFTLLTTPLPDSRLASVVKSFPTLVTLCRNIEGAYFKKGFRESGRSSRNEGEASRSGRTSRNEGEVSRSGRTSRNEGEVSRSGRTSRNEDVKSGRTSRNEGGDLRSGRTSRNEGEVASGSKEEGGQEPQKVAGADDKNGGSNGDYDKLEDISQVAQ